MNELFTGVATVISAIAALLVAAKGLEAILKIKETRAKGKTDNEIAQAAAITASWQAAQEAMNRNIADIWTELNWLRDEREFDIQYIDELHTHIDELRDIALSNGLKVPPTPRRRQRTPPPPRSRNPVEVFAELNQAANIKTN